jgi:hypothetical protein
LLHPKHCPALYITITITITIIILLLLLLLLRHMCAHRE